MNKVRMTGMVREPLPPVFLATSTRISELIEGLGSWLRSTNPVFLTLIVSLFSLAKFGVDLHGDGDIRASAAALPLPANHVSPALFGSLLYRILGLSLIPWIAFTLVLAIATALLVVTYVVRSGAPGTWRLALFLVVTWPMIAVVFQQAGHYQSLYIFMVTLSLLVRNSWLAVFLTVLACLSIPEQAFLAYLSLMIITFTPQFARWRRVAAIGTVAGLLTTIGATVWLRLNGIESRAEVAPQLLIEGIKYSISEGWMGIIAWWGPWWLLILIIMSSMQLIHRWIFAIGSIVAPGFATILTLDGTRVFVGVATAVAIACLLAYVGASTPTALARLTDRGCATPKSKVSKDQTYVLSLDRNLGLWGLAMVLFPSLVVEWNLGVEAPWFSGLEAIEYLWDGSR